ncbi:MAG: hypothetical protein ABIP29_01085 [Candidatus Eisenbacteria bacterium]
MPLTPEEFLAGLLKLLAALPVLRWPLAGALLAIVADGLDVVVMNYVDLGGGGIRDYHLFDKLTDLPSLVTFLVVALRWQGTDRAIAVGLFAWRAAGVVLFELTGWRGALIAFPNLFESWFLFVLLRDALGARSAWARGALLGGLAAFKVAQELLVHGFQVLDRLNLSEVVGRIFGGS